MNEMPSTPAAPQEYVFSSEIKLEGKKYEVKLRIEEEYVIIKVSEKYEDNAIKRCYEESYTIEYLQGIHKFFRLYENVVEAFNAIKTAIIKDSYKLEENENEIILIIFCFDKEIKITIHSKSQTDDEMIANLSNNLNKLKQNFQKKLKEFELFNEKFLKLKKKCHQLNEENKELRKNNEKITEENKELQETMKNIKEVTGKAITDNFEHIMKIMLMSGEEKAKEKVARGLRKLKGDLLNENTIAFDDNCKAYLCNWILNDNKNRTVNTILLYKGSRDGDKAATFHEKCNKKGATLTLIKTTEGYHFGGYTPTQWESIGKHRSSPDSFLFSLDKKLKYPPKSAKENIFDKFNFGPTFGGGYDLYIADECMNNAKSYSYPSSYDITDTFSGSEEFEVSEIEVYQIIFT